MATHASILSWKIPWTEEPGALQSMGSHMQLSTHAGIISGSDELQKGKQEIRVRDQRAARFYFQMEVGVREFLSEEVVLSRMKLEGKSCEYLTGTAFRLLGTICTRILRQDFGLIGLKINKGQNGWNTVNQGRTIGNELIEVARGQLMWNTYLY